jgi:hypothetical protein
LITRVLQKKTGARVTGRRTCCSYFALPVPLVDGLVAVSLEGAVRLDASPGPAVVPVVEGALRSLRTLGAALAPPTALPVDPPAALPVTPRLASRMQFSRSVPTMPVQRLVSLFIGAPAARSRCVAGSPADWGLGCTPPVGPRPTALAPAGPPDWARIILSPSADACADNGRAKAPATATANKVLIFIAVS